MIPSSMSGAGTGFADSTQMDSVIVLHILRLQPIPADLEDAAET